MKTLINISINGNQQHDAIVVGWMSPVKNVHGEIEYTNPEGSIAKCKGKGDVVLFYVEHKGAHVKVELTASSIKKLHAEILRMEEITSEEFIDP